jgi:transposase-like protein
MPPPCSICAHQRRREIDEALASGESVEPIAKKFGIPATNLRRHRSHTEKKAAGLDPKRARRLKQLEENRTWLMKMREEAIAEGASKEAMTAQKEITRVDELIAQIEIGATRSSGGVLSLEIDEQTATRIAQTYLSRRGKSA